MNLLITGRGSSGSWKIRGEQLGYALGATVIPLALDVAAFDAAVIVKRPGVGVVQRLQAAGIPIIWDVVDAWPQPDGNLWPREDCMAWLTQQVRSMQPRAIVAATRAMGVDCAAFGVPVYVLPHHARPGLGRAPIRRLQTIGYEGGLPHLGSWQEALQAMCARRGLQFVVNPPALTDLDIVVAMRERDGYAPMHWKSNVKLANAQAAGLPIICAPEAGYIETACGAEAWATTAADVERAIDMMTPIKVRQVLSERMHAAAPNIGDILPGYKRWLKGVACATASSS